VKDNTPYVVGFENKSDAKHIVKSLTMYNAMHKKFPSNEDIFICRPKDLSEWDTSKQKQVNIGLFDEEMLLIELFKLTEFRNIGVSMIELENIEENKGIGISYVNVAPIDNLEKEQKYIDKLEQDLRIN
jgi:hypothetical protein